MKKLFYTTGISIALIFAACSNNKSEQAESAAADIAEPGAGTAAVSKPTAKLAKTADIDFKVNDVRTSSNKIHRTVKEFGGIVMDNSIQTIQIDSKTIPVGNDSLQLISSYQLEARMAVRVPSESLSDFVQSVAADATVLYSAKLHVDDRSIEYLGSSRKQQSRTQILRKELKKDTLKTDQLLKLADQQDAIIDGQMNNLRTDADVRYSTISLHFDQNIQVKKENLANTDLRHYRSPLNERLAGALSSGFNFFVDIIIALIFIWPFVLIGLGVWIAYLYLQKKWKAKAWG